MPVFTVRGPDGRTHRVRAPEGATEQQAIAYVADTIYADRVTSEPEETEAAATPAPTLGRGTPITDRAAPDTEEAAAPTWQPGRGPIMYGEREDPGALADIANFLGSTIGGRVRGAGEAISNLPSIGRRMIADQALSAAIPGGSTTPQGLVLSRLLEAGAEGLTDLVTPGADEAYAEAVAPIAEPLIQRGRATQTYYTPFTSGSATGEYSRAREEGESVPYALWRGARSVLLQTPAMAFDLGAAFAAGRVGGPRAAAATLGASSALASYGGIRAQQEQEGIDDPARAFSAALASGALDAVTGLGGRAVSATTRNALQQDMARGISGAVREVLKTGRSEAGTEMLQNVIEQVGGGQDPLTQESLLQTLDAGVVGFAGGVVLGTPIEGLNRRQQSNLRRAFGQQPSLRTVDVNVPGDGGRPVPTTLDILSAPDASGNIVVRTAEGTPYVDSLANIEAMRPAPAQGETRENLADALTDAEMRSADNAALTAAVNALLSDPNDGSARGLLRARLRSQHGIPDYLADQIVDSAIQTAATSAPQTGQEAAATSVVNSINRAAAGKNKAVKAAQEQAVAEAQEVAAAVAQEQPKRKGRKAPAAPAAPAATAPLPPTRFQPLALNEATTRFPKAEAARNAFFNGAVGTTPEDFFAGRSTKMTKAEVEAFNAGREWGASQGQTVSPVELTLIRPKPQVATATPLADRMAAFNEANSRFDPKEEDNLATAFYNAATGMDRAAFEQQGPTEGELNAWEQGLEWAAGTKRERGESGVPSAGGRAGARAAAAPVAGADESGVGVAGGVAGGPAARKGRGQPTVTKVAPGEARGIRETRTGMMGTQRGRPVEGAAALTEGMRAEQELYAELEAARKRREISDEEMAQAINTLRPPVDRDGNFDNEAYKALPANEKSAWGSAIAAQKTVDEQAEVVSAIPKEVLGQPNPERVDAEAELAKRQRNLDDAQRNLVNIARDKVRGRTAERKDTQTAIRELLKDPNLTEEQRRDLQIQLRETKVDRKYRRKGAGVGLDVDAVKAHIAKIISGWRAKVDVQTVGSLDELPADVREAVIADGAQDAQGLVAPDGTIYIFAQNLDTLEDATATVYHEALGHMGLKALFGKRLDSVLQSILDSNKNLREAAEQWMRDNPGAYQGDNATLRALEEVLVERSEGGRLQASIWSKIVGVFKDFGRRIGMKLDYTDSEVRTLLAMAHDMIVDGPQTSAAMDGLRYMVSAWHGGPYDFDRFSTEAIGTGEGHAAYGWGLYFGSKRAVGEHYRNQEVARRATIDDKSMARGKGRRFIEYGGDFTMAERRALVFLRNTGTLEYTLERLQRDVNSKFSSAESKAASQEKIDTLTRLAEEGRLRIPKGSLYEVTLLPEDDEWMDWKEPIDKQSDKVQAALASLGFSAEEERRTARQRMEEADKDMDEATARGDDTAAADANARFVAAERDLLYPLTGADVYDRLKRKLGSKKDASIALLKAGVRGNRYLDALSRSYLDQDTSYNYVLFDDADVEIVNKYSRKKAKPKTAAEEAADIEARAAEKTRKGVEKLQRSMEAGGVRDPDAIAQDLTSVTEAATEQFHAVVDKFVEPLTGAAKTARRVGGVTSVLINGLRKVAPGAADIADNMVEAMGRMGQAQRDMTKALGKIGKGLQTFVESDPTALARLAYSMQIARNFAHDPTLHRTQADALANDRYANSLRKEIADLSKNIKTEKDAAAKKELTATLNKTKLSLRKRELDIAEVWKAWEALGKLPGGQFQWRQQQQFYKDAGVAYETVSAVDIDMLDVPDQVKQKLKEAEKGSEDPVTDAGHEYPGVKASLLDPVYFPYMRFGDHVAIVKWSGKNGGRRRLEFDSMADRAAWERKFKRDNREALAEGKVSYRFTNKADLSAEDASDSENAALRDVFQAIEKSVPKGSTDEQAAAFKKQLKDRVYQVFLKRLPERSLKKQFIHAKLVEGQSPDVPRVFADYAQRYASQLPKLMARPQLERMISEGVAALDDMQGVDPLAQERAREVFGLISQHVMNEFSAEELSGWAKYLNLGAFGALMGSVLTVGIQLTAFPLNAIPKLLAKYPIAAPVLMARYLEVLPQVPIMPVEVDPVTGDRVLTVPSFGNTPFVKNNKLRKKIFDELRARGLFSQHVTDLSLGDMAAGKPSTLRAGANKVEAAIRASAVPMSAMDQLIFEMTGLMFAELAYKKSGNLDDAIKSAVRDTQDALGNFSEVEQPNVFRGPVGRIFRFLRTYSVQMAVTYGRLFHNSFKGAPYQTRVEAISELAMRYFMVSLFAGPAATFLSSVGFFLAEAVFSLLMDDDEEDEFRNEHPLAFRKSFSSNITGTEFDAKQYLLYDLIPSYFGTDTDMTRSLQKGVISNALNIDLSGRVGHDALFIRDWQSGDTGVETMFNFLSSNLTPQFSVGVNMVKAWDAAMKGDFARAAKGFLPSWVRGPVLSREYAEEGMRTGRGAASFSPEDIERGFAPPRPGSGDPLQGLTREEARGMFDGLTVIAMGGQPLDIALAYERDINPLFDIRRYRDRRAEIRQSIREALGANTLDVERLRGIKTEIDEFNSSLPYDLRAANYIDEMDIAESLLAAARDNRLRGYPIEDDEAILLARERGLLTKAQADALTLQLAVERASK